MKNQYFGDINDYRKYGFLRAIQADLSQRLLVAWMLTPDDGSNDGRSRGYLSKPREWRRLDPELFDALTSLLLTSGQSRLGSIERSGLLANTTFHSTLVPDDRTSREEWRAGLFEAARGADLVFLDPDTGIETPSKPIGRKGSSKYVAWPELHALWGLGASLIVYQHLRRLKTSVFARRQAEALSERTGALFVQAFSAKSVLYLCAIQERHDSWLRTTLARLDGGWIGRVVATVARVRT